MMASASAMTYTPSVNSGGNSADPANSSATHSTSCENELLALDISTNGTSASRTTNKRTYFERACITFPGDSESPKKRRKQSTPVKIPTSATNPDAEETEPQSEQSEGKLEPSISSSPALGNSIPSPDIFSPSSIKQADEEVAVSQSSPTASNPLSQNIQSELFKIDFGTPSWMSDMPNKQQEEWLNAPPIHNVPFSFPSLQSPGLSGQVSQFPLMDSNQQSAHLLGRPINQPRIRIFNPDAYCELCNKEFCNKYFLKTHKANKHGIYTDLPVTEMNFTVTTTAATVSTKTVTLTTNPEQVSSVPTPPKPQESLTPKITSTLLTATCDICQKKFCNKNFVRRHKVKVHGIVEETDADNENSNLDQNISDSNSETNTPKQVSTSPNSNYYPEGLPECLKPFLDTEFDQDNVPYRWPMVSVQSPTALNQQVREAIHRPRGLGIVNPEAFCEICCKEYCNKYFLRTHKLKRHGIAIPDDPPKEAGTSSDGRNMQTSPLNLIKSEQTSSSESYSERKDASDMMMCGICGVHVSQKYMKAHYEACHIIKSASTENPATSTSTSSPLSATGANNEDFNMSETTSNDKPPTTALSTEENINEDLKKLQTMILQLNNLNVCQIVTCNVCCKEFENKFYLQAHMMSDHGQLYMKITDEKISIQNTSAPPPQAPQPPPPPPPQSAPSGASENSSKPTIPETKPYCPSADTAPASELQQQRLTPQQQVTSLPDNVSIQTTVRTTVTPSSVAPSATSERRLSVSLAPTNSYCEICNKELCNKYFMKTHMQRMHGIEIENGAQIGGVVCNICNKELCSKYFLRVHKHNTHGIVEDGMPLPQSRQTSEETSQPPPSIPTPSTSEQPQQFTITDPSLKPNELGDLNHRYFAHFTEVCPICSRRFRSTKWLKAHLVTDHGKAEHDKWEELELLYQKQTNKAQTDSQPKSSVESDTSNSIKIPNGRESEDGPENKLGIQNLLSNIFGQDELNSKKYFCSFCNFSTPVLAFLFVHERSHGQPPLFNKNENIFQCPICVQTYPSAELLQQHIVMQHANVTPKQFSQIQATKSPILAATMSAEGNSSSLPSDDKPPLIQEIKDDTINGNETPKPAKRLTRNEISANIRRLFHGDLQNLQEMSQQLQLPTTYALPQTQPHQGSKDEQDITQPDSPYMMQPFLIEEYVQKGETKMGVQLQLVPSIVFLPVREKITTPLTTSIKFTPT